ncbi:hypothetical protein OIDMADRAFT_50104 [Oidiodendron maius Zn]|uniref:Uncharacterized protein n=1 Tax=Oidiodendron maius (strain Zn) TaxID=913774 RepID=A0A0C3HUF6_OIDMZ|nr:hypothetical protein OIDMADRAFT_50104 [Oidiodendron maius Zn]
MAQEVSGSDNSEGCCIGGFVIKTCGSCQGQPRIVSKCKGCKGAGAIRSPCLVHAASATDYTVQSGTTSGGSAGYGGSYGSKPQYGQDHSSTSSQQ